MVRRRDLNRMCTYCFYKWDNPEGAKEMPKFIEVTNATTKKKILVPLGPATHFSESPDGRAFVTLRDQSFICEETYAQVSKMVMAADQGAQSGPQFPPETK